MHDDSLPHDLLTAALAYAAQGRAVFALAPGTKNRPRTKWRHGDEFQRATTDTRVIRWWWRKWPRANIGLVTGEGLAVVDIDPRAGTTTPDDWPATLTALTPSGGWHLVYAVDGPVPNSASALAPGLDIRGDGGMVCAAPSSTEHGSYAWVDPDTPVTELAAELLTPPSTTRNGSTGTQSSGFELPDSIPTGERNWTLFRYAGQLWGAGYSEHDLEHWLHEANTALCTEPLPEDELERIVGSITRYEQ